MTQTKAETQTYVITGASRGIGLEFVRQLSKQEGNIVYAGARNPEGSKELMKLVDHKKVFPLTIDIDSRESIEKAAEEVAKTATEGIDVLINNAGTSTTAGLHAGDDSSSDIRKQTVLKVPREEYTRVFETNVGGVSDVTQVFVPLLRKRGNDKLKKIINLSTGLASISSVFQFDPASTNSAYKVSKTALNILSQLFAARLAAESFTVIVLSPGWVRTDMGSADAQLDVDEAVGHMLKLFSNLTAADNGRFLSYDGQELPW